MVKEIEPTASNGTTEYSEPPKAWENIDDNAAPSAIDAQLKTREEVANEFKQELGFDPSDLDEMSKHVTQMDESFLKDHVYQLIELQKAMTEMLIARFDNNMQAFKKFMPDIYEQFKNFRPSEPLEFMCTSNGVPNLYFPARGEFFYKVYDPVELCNSQVDLVLERSPFRQLNYGLDAEQLGQIHHRYLNHMVDFNKQHIPNVNNPSVTGSCPICIIVGCGLGYHLGHLYEKVDIGNLVLIEPNIDLFFASLHAFDWANLLNYLNENNRGIYLMVGQTKEEVFEDLNNYYQRHGRMLACYMWSMVHYRSKEINEISDRIVEDYERAYATLGFYDDHLFAVSHGISHLHNHVHFVKRNVDFPKKWQEDTPFVVVANGPSLSHDLPFLRKIQDKVVILACGTAVETLYNAGIRPTFYGATERLRIVSEHLSLIPDREFLKDLILVTGDVIHPEVVKFFDHTAVFGKGDETFFWLAAGKIYDQWREVMPISLMNPLVGNLGVAAATQFGFKNIYLFGVDNGTKRDDLKTHPDENLFYNRESSDSDDPVPSYKRLVYSLEGNFGGVVYSDYLYKLSARYMEVIIRNAKANNKLNYFNCSDGAALKEVEPVHSEDLLEKWLALPDFDRDEFVRFMDEEKTFAIELTEEQDKSLIDNDTFDYICHIIIKLLTKEERPKTRIDYVFMLQSVSEMLNKIHETRDYYIADFFDGSLAGMFAMVMRTVYLVKNEQLALDLADQQIQFIVYFIEDAMKLYRFMPDYLAEDHQVHLKGLVGYNHGNCHAHKLDPRKPYVTQADTDKYPTRKFVKRYE
ncbi:MAG: 6-hydroxymethylpterin diphosphokinase MptE-like protein [Anaerobiospirillum succiniciproducens]|uniref:motility associated factor glycosyltransferase family protein n=1 Tax=Anaerobiospirillum succiniciproducens TaxID=13335 RepID=UPI002A74D3B2|nr:6-hydroxymethylpterin diphosphokinase MptE-like protein [Anaerobiospirillum succiniciproducens]MDY2798316.1 6-hydroxymethylpterin diphosphokinase MptE-like protein [Anaerobiospirillum succiniciproducens]